MTAGQTATGQMTTGRADAAPLFSDCFALSEWLLGRLGRDMSVLPQTICRNALDMFDHVLLALKGIERDIHLDDADSGLVVLRAHVRLAASTGFLSQEQLMHTFVIMDRIGKQLGGWQRSLDTL